MADSFAVTDPTPKGLGTTKSVSTDTDSLVRGSLEILVMRHSQPR